MLPEPGVGHATARWWDAPAGFDAVPIPRAFWQPALPASMFGIPEQPTVTNAIAASSRSRRIPVVLREALVVAQGYDPPVDRPSSGRGLTPRAVDAILGSRKATPVGVT